MRCFARRALTTGEIALGRTVFGDEIAWESVRIQQLPPFLFAAMVPLGRAILFGRWRAARDFSVAPLVDQGWFVHELAHVWQAAHGVWLACAKLRALGRGAYQVHWFPGAVWDDYNIEAQAEVARFVFLTRLGAPAPLSRETLEALWAQRLTPRRHHRSRPA